MKAWRVVFAMWVFVWLLFLARGLAKGEFMKFKALLPLNKDEKVAYILGEGLSGFLKHCKTQMPQECTYKIIGDLTEHNRFRLVYYLYPRLESDNPDYILKIYPKGPRYILERLR